jgi:hypothetical protein
MYHRYLASQTVELATLDARCNDAEALLRQYSQRGWLHAPALVYERLFGDVNVPALVYERLFGELSSEQIVEFLARMAGPM